MKNGLDISLKGAQGWGGEGGNGTPLLAQPGNRQAPPFPPPQLRKSIASEAGVPCGFVGQVAPVATKYRRGREARRASIYGLQPRKGRTRFNFEKDEFQAQDLESDSSTTANTSTRVRCQYPELVRVRSGSAEKEKTGRFSRHRERARRMASLQDPLRAYSFF